MHRCLRWIVSNQIRVYLMTSCWLEKSTRWCMLTQGKVWWLISGVEPCHWRWKNTAKHYENTWFVLIIYKTLVAATGKFCKSTIATKHYSLLADHSSEESIPPPIEDMEDECAATNSQQYDRRRMWIQTWLKFCSWLGTNTECQRANGLILTTILFWVG